MIRTRLTWSTGTAPSVQWRGGVIPLLLLRDVNAALRRKTLDDEERSYLVDLIEQTMIAKGGTLWSVDDLPARARSLLSL